MLNIFSLFLMSSLLSQFSLAGVGSTGGGFAVVCRDSSSFNIQQATLLDLYEAKVRDKKNLFEPIGNLKEEFIRAFRSYSKIKYNIAEKEVTEAEIKKFFDGIKSAFIFVTNPTLLENTKDIGSTIKVPKGCLLEQVAVANYETKKVLVNAEIYENFDSLNQMALFVHEIIYQSERKKGATTSESTRKMVGDIFSENFSSDLLLVDY